LNRWHPVR